MVEGLKRIDWYRLRSHDGYGDDLPRLLRQARTSVEPHEELVRHLCGDESEVSEATAAAWPFLLDLVAHDNTPGREWLLENVCGAIAVAGGSGSDGVHPSWPPAWEASKPALLALLDHSAVAVRRGALFVLGQGRGDSAPVLAALAPRWDEETDPATRLCLVVVATEFAGRGDEAALSWLRELEVPDDEPLARMLVSAATRPDAGVVLRGLTGDLGLFLETGQFEMGYDEVLEHVLWLVRPHDFEGMDLVLALVDVLPWRTEALDYLRRLFERDTADVGLVVPYVPVWAADPDVRLRAFAVWLVGVARARQYRRLVEAAVHDHAVTSLGQRVSSLATSVLLDLR
ncbi:hypothetical protein [Lentzea jiangxiensis]|uniref:HEAT repeat-containing protein n=1 Tax=Lentzea jiangxiensis TaxID=641025 RepID=A0A1H0V510_9PSEU|nr:hypothetical protein [Lentzea jiangxiensis]SDP73451.1 hypothetical protein SAMN05421507_113170 [Lentzea jiangxiensis]